MEIITIETPSLGDRSYVLVSGGIAAIIDPQRDIDRIESLLKERSLRLTHVFETQRLHDLLTAVLRVHQHELVAGTTVLAVVDVWEHASTAPSAGPATESDPDTNERHATSTQHPS